MHFTVLCWIISSWWMYFFCQSSQTDYEYSKRGLTYVLYAVSLILLLKDWMLRLMNFRVLFPLTVIWLICLLQERSSDILIWRVERVIILFCYFNCNSIIYIFVFISFVTFIILILSLSFYHSNIRLYNKL